MIQVELEEMNALVHGSFMSRSALRPALAKFIKSNLAKANEESYSQPVA
ncbi:MAG TPA: hypothetical protein VL095_12210 [Flavisolibacter sp.]|nr:hypothetical protein [Flavisolibacter sp.]